jgi:uncharacterized protein (DUF433 family)
MARNGLLVGGIYTIPDVAELVEAEQAEVRIWIEGRKGRQDPVIDNQVGRIGRKVAVSFTNLMELRFVAFFSKAGVRLNEIRRIMGEVRNEIAHPHPFATRTVFATDGRKIVAKIGRQNGVEAIYDLRTKNYEMGVVVLDTLKKDVEFDPEGEAISWRPRPRTAPNVIIHPSFAFGHPILRESGIPTATIADAVKAEGGVADVAVLYDVPVKQVREAMRFEKSLRMAA